MQSGVFVRDSPWNSFGHQGFACLEATFALVPTPGL